MAPAWAQQGDPVNQSGNVTPGHPMVWVTNNTAGDGGTAAQGVLTGLGVTASGSGICQNSGPVSGPYNQICLGVTTSGGTLGVNNYNGASGTLTLAGNVTLASLIGQIQCLQVNAVGVITGTGSACGSGGGGGGVGGLNGQLQFNNNGVLGGVSTTSVNGSTITFQSGSIQLAGASSGTAFLISQPVSSGTISIPNGTDTLAGVSLVQTLTNKTISSAILVGTQTGNTTFNGTYTFNGSNNFSSTSFLWNGVTQTFPPSGNLVGVADTQVLLNKSINGSEINSGTVLAAFLPVATAAFQGIVQGDGATLTITAGTISCTTATNSQNGCSRPDGTTITTSAGGVLTAVAPSASSISVGITLVSGGTNGFVLYNNAGTLGNVATTGSGNAVLATSPTLSGTIGGNLTFNGNLSMSGLLTSATIAGSLCIDSSFHVINVTSQGCFGVGVLSLNTLSGNLTLAAGTQQSIASSGTTVTIGPVLRGYIAGLIESNDGTSPNTVLDIAAGVATDSTNVVMMNVGAFTKSTGGSWAVGSGSNGMGNGLTIAASTWYHVCLANNGGTPDYWFDTSAACANKPVGITDTKFRRIGSFRTNASSQIVAFSQNGDEILWVTSFADVNSQAAGTSSRSLFILTVPTGVKVNALFRSNFSGVGLQVVFTSPDESDQAASGAVVDINSTGSGFGLTMTRNIRTNTNAQIGARGTGGGGTFSIATYGYIDTRGKYN